MNHATHGAVLQGIHAIPVTVEVQLMRRLPSITIVGHAHYTVRESTERVRSAIEASGYTFPAKKVVINLAPAEMPKCGASLDVPIALAILQASGVLKKNLQDFLFVGELGLSGEIRPVRGAIAFTRLSKRNDQHLVVAPEMIGIARWVPEAHITQARSLKELVNCLNQEATWSPLPPAKPHAPPPSEADMSMVRGQAIAKRALEIAATGGHHLLFIGPPGCGKSMLAKMLIDLLPALNPQQALECLHIREARDGFDTQYSLIPPFQAPHHTSSAVSLAGGSRLKPGFVSMAHHGVLFLDEAPEFRRDALESLREPLEEGVIRIHRADGTVVFPAKIQLVMAANPCPCGYRLSRTRCRCTPSAIRRYINKLSGPLLDRIDLQVALSDVSGESLFSKQSDESNTRVHTRIQNARAFAQSRQQYHPNAHIEGSEVVSLTKPTKKTITTLQESMSQLNISARGALRLLRVARTIADLQSSIEIRPTHLFEALSFRVQLVQ